MERFVTSVCLVLTFLTSAYATTVRRLSFDDLVAKAQTIVSGQVIDSRTYRTPDGKLILTSYTVQVRELIKGKTPPIVTITTVGGQIGNTVLRVLGMPRFQTGENAILFLEQSGTYTTVVGLNQGKFNIANGEVSNTVTGLSFADSNPGKALTMPVDEFKRQIQRRIIQ